jgi:hypothetical protein
MKKFRKFRWYTSGELTDLVLKRTRSFHEEDGLDGGGRELGDGWRLWATANAWFVIPLATALFFNDQIRTSLGLLLMFLLAPLAMTAGYLFGATARNFPFSETLAIARQQLFIQWRVQIRRRTLDGKWTTEEIDIEKPLAAFINVLMTERADEIRESMFYCIVFASEEEDALARLAEGLLSPMSTSKQAVAVLEGLVRNDLAQIRTEPGYVTYIPKNPYASIGEGESILAYVLKATR